MFQEKDFEDILSKYPELIEDGLVLKGRQVHVYGRIMDLLFEDKFKRKLIVELKKGPIKDDHIGQVMSYEGMLLSSDDPTIRVMLIGNRVPPNIQRTLDHHGIAWREITCTRLSEFLSEKNDQELMGVLANSDESQFSGSSRYKVIQAQLPVPTRVLTPDELISVMKKSEDYQSFSRVLDRKKENEEKAKNIILQNLGYINHENLHEVIALVDEKYPCTVNGRNVSGTWFGRLLNSNTGNLFETDLNKINNWFNTLTNPYLTLEKKFAFLLNEPNNIKGLNVGFLTLMLYLIDKSNYSIWFEGLHDGYRKIFPEEAKYIGRVDQYLAYNKATKELTAKYAFDHTEIDWVFSTGVYLEFAEKYKQLQSTFTYENDGWESLDQRKYTLEQIFLRQNTKQTVQELAAEFHKSLGRYFAEKNLSWWARTHSYGCSYFCNQNKCFQATNISSNEIIVHYYTGQSQIPGLEKSTWTRKEDGKGSKPFHINNKEDFRKALIFAEAAYRISESESSRNDYQYEYWEGFKFFMEEQKSFVKIRRPQSKSWTDVSIGKSDIYIAAGFSNSKKIIMIWLVICGRNSKQVFDFLYRNYYQESKEKISSGINWDRMDRNQRSAVILERTADILDMKSRQEQFGWFKEHLEKYEAFFKPIVKSLRTY